MTIIGLDIGGTKIEGILWSDGRVLNSQKIKTSKNRRRFLKELMALVGSLTSKRTIQGIGVSCAGAIEAKTGKIINSPNMKFLNGLRLANVISRKFRVRARIENDTNCFLLGEAKFGAARGRKNVAALTLGTGVGGAVFMDSRMLKGAHVSAAELGHMIIRDNLSVEDLCSSHFFKRFNLGGALEVQRKAERGNKKAKLIYRELGQNLGIALANVVNIFDPELIILGGGISRGAHLFLKPAVAEMKKYSLTSLQNFLPPVKISKVKHVGALGAIALFF